MGQLLYIPSKTHQDLVHFLPNLRSIFAAKRITTLPIYSNWWIPPSPELFYKSFLPIIRTFTMSLNWGQLELGTIVAQTVLFHIHRNLHDNVFYASIYQMQDGGKQCINHALNRSCHIQIFTHKHVRVTLLVQIGQLGYIFVFDLSSKMNKNIMKTEWSKNS